MPMRFILIIFCLLWLPIVVCSQELDDDLYRYKIDGYDSYEQMAQSDTTLFYRTLSVSDLYEQITSYRFSFVENSRRGFYFTSRTASLDGLTLRRSNISLLRRLGLTERTYSGLAHGDDDLGGIAGADAFSTREAVPLGGGNVGLFFSGRGYLGGVRATINSLMRRGWSLTLYASARGGDDLHVKGVYNNSIDGGLRLAREFNSGARFSLVALSTMGERGLRSGSTEEAFSLTGDNLYNPAWGYQSGRERTSRYRRDAVPYVMMSFSVPIGDATQMLIAAGSDYGRRSYSTLGWYDAMTPRPDNYRYLPSYFTNADVAALVSERWRAGDDRYTQISWSELYAVNRMSSTGAAYAMDERVERIARIEAQAIFTTRIDERVTIRYGLRGIYNSSRNFKLLRDMMGATLLHDIDYYLMDDDTFSNHLRNNLRSQTDLVAEGDRFSYDYDLVERRLMAELGIEFSSQRWHFGADMSVGSHWTHRRGYFEKELFPGDKSFGRSKEQLFNPYTIKASIDFAPSVGHNLSLAAMVAEVTPQVRYMFLNPLYNNRLVDDLTTEKLLSAELSYRHSSQRADISVAAFYTLSRDGRQTYRAYDDLSATYADVDISRLGELHYGVEAAAELRFSEHWRASLSASAGEYKYSENPLVALYDDTDNSPIATASDSYVGDCHIGGAPSLSGSAEITYLNYNGWIFSLGVQGVAMRYVDPSFVRRTERVMVQGAASEEIHRQFLTQQRLDDAWTMDASLSRWFDVGRSRLSLTLSVRNLLGYDDIVYGGYESSRIRNYTASGRRIYSPQEDILTYSYPRTYYAVVSWKF